MEEEQTIQIEDLPEVNLDSEEKSEEVIQKEIEEINDSNSQETKLDKFGSPVNITDSSPVDVKEDIEETEEFDEVIETDDWEDEPEDTEDEEDEPEEEEIDLETLRTKIEDIKDNLISDEVMDELKELKLKSFKDNLYLAKLFLNCYDIIYINLNYFKIDGENKVKKLLNKICCEKNVDIKSLRKYLTEYGDGNEIGSNYTRQDIYIIVDDKREVIIELINLFFGIFGDEV